MTHVVRYAVRSVPDSGRYIVVDSDTSKIVSRHLTYAVALRHAEKLAEQERKHTQPGELS